MKHEIVLVIDFGGQYNQLIARRVRENNVYCEILPCTVDIERIKEKNPKGIIFTGGPNSAYLEDSPKISKEVFELGVPILGICYGDQLMAHLLGGTVCKGDNQTREYGKTIIEYKDSPLFKGIDSNQVWMSHTDYISDMLLIALCIIGILLFEDIIKLISISQLSCFNILIPLPNSVAFFRCSSRSANSSFNAL